jgi:phage RecT family recombinase
VAPAKNARRQPASENQTNTQTAVVPTKAETPYAKVERALEAKRDQIVKMYGGDQRLADRMRMVALHALADPKLARKLEQADFATVIEALRESASLGLMPIGSTAEGYLVPRKNSAKTRAAGHDVYDFTFLPGWRGLLKLTLASEKVTAVDAEVVYENDLFEYEKGTTPTLRHVRVLRERGNVIATYAIAYLRDGPPIFEIMDEAEMEMIRRSSTSRDYDTGNLIGPWMDWPDEMRRKSALRRLDKRLPLSHLGERALQYEAEIDEKYALPDPSRGQQQRQLPATAAGRARAAFTDEPAMSEGDEPAENGSGRPESGEAATDATSSAGGQQGPSTAVTDDPEGEGEGREICGAPGTREGQFCTEDPGHEPPHGDSKEVWG